MTSKQESNALNRLGVVVIGRNEGERLEACLNSIAKHELKIVYVDSGSSDNSIKFAKSIGVEVVELDLTIPFTAARARNEGVNRMMELAPAIRYIQFVDGDCEILPHWFSDALEAIEYDDELAVVCGQRKEIYPDASIYNYICDLEWNTPIGPAKACGGDALMRVSAFLDVGGFRNDLIAGEEPELCVRLRQSGWRIERIDSIMTMHDASILKFSQWWKRSKRAGHAFIEGAFLHGFTEERHWVVETLRPWVWSAVIPALMLISFFTMPKLCYLLIGIYCLQIARMVAQKKKHGFIKSVQLALLSLLGKFAEFHGQLSFLWTKMVKQRHKIIEYK